MRLQTLEKLDAIIESVRRAARIPGAAIAIVAGGKTIYAKGFGCQSLNGKKRVTVHTVYPIASTSKAINATLLGMLVDDGLIEWDAPVQRYLPHFLLRDAVISSRVTVRDLLTMRTGLPRHDWVWWGSTINRADLIKRMAYLELSADFRQRFQYSNLSATAAGHIVEVVTGQSWEALVCKRIFRPLGMRNTSCARPGHGTVTSSFHENAKRKLLPSRRLAAGLIAPSGGAVHSTVTDMARWLSFNLKGGKVQGRRLLREETLRQIHAPQVIVGDCALTTFPPEGAYALGWMVDYYNGHRRLSHGGYLHDVNSSLMLFPEVGMGMVSFTNFGPPLMADLINQHAFNTVVNLKPVETLEEKLAGYEAKIAATRRRNATVRRVPHTKPSRPLSAYLGQYKHPGYGDVRIRRRGRRLALQRHGLTLDLQHWHYDVWVAEDNDMWAIHQPHAFDRASQMHFHVDSCGRVEGLSIPLDPEVAPIRFEKATA